MCVQAFWSSSVLLWDWSASKGWTVASTSPWTARENCMARWVHIMEDTPNRCTIQHTEKTKSHHTSFVTDGICCTVKLTFPSAFISAGEAISWMCFQGAIWGKLVQHLLIQHLPAWRKGCILLCCSKQRWDIPGWNKVKAASAVHSLPTETCGPGKGTRVVQRHTELKFQGCQLKPLRPSDSWKAIQVHLMTTLYWGSWKTLLIWTKLDHMNCTKSTLPTAGMEEGKQRILN